VREPVETLSGDPTLELPEFDAPPDEPLSLLESWLKGADVRGVREPRALALATADAARRPSNRIVLLKQVSPSIVFAFSARSRKGRDIAANPRAAGTLYRRETLQPHRSRRHDLQLQRAQPAHRSLGRDHVQLRRRRADD
jgi:pyridoxine/pyridoxamine 5'-phosphate oxidase